SSPIPLASMVERVHHDIRWLQFQHCTAISIVAHSQGAAVAHHALRSFPSDHQRVPFRRFITFGAAIEKLNFLQKIDVGGKSLLRGGILQSLWALLLALSLILAWRISWLGIDGHWWTLGLWLLFTCLFWLSPLISRWLLGAEPIDYVEPRRDDLWSRQNSDGSTAIWDDIYARSDPVSLGPIKRLGDASVEIRNQDSIVFDHTSYFENTEQFMVRLVGGLASDSGWTDLFDPAAPALAAAASQRSRRVDWLNRAFVTVAATILLASIALLLLGRLDETGKPAKTSIEFLGEEPTIPFEGVVRSYTGDGEVAEAVLGLATLIVSAVAIFTVLIKGMWHRWNASKADRLLRHEPLGPFFEDGQWFLLMTVAVPVAAALYVALLAW
ncbi:MAG TPA: hypothetical protein VD789_03410, partial [Thermomicrobiales bacterium]|nr:hypothetical protein [Thermomicrobiales bacterium]